MISQVFSSDKTDKPLMAHVKHQNVEELACPYLVPAKCRAVGCASGWGGLGHYAW